MVHSVLPLPKIPGADTTSLLFLGLETNPGMDQVVLRYLLPGSLHRLLLYLLDDDPGTGTMVGCQLLTDLHGIQHEVLFVVLLVPVGQVGVQQHPEDEMNA